MTSPALRIALIGAGWVSQHHLRGWRTVSGASVVAICDRDFGAATARAAEFGVSDVHTDAATLLDAVKPDAIDIAAPPDAHASLCALAAERHVATICQKPLASSLCEATAIVATARGRCRLTVHENWRYREPYRRAGDWLARGMIGDVRQLRLTTATSGLLAREDGTRPALARQPLLAQLPRLAIGELLIHHLDVARWLLGTLQVTACEIEHRCEAVRGESAASIRLRAHDDIDVEIAGDFCVADAPTSPRDHLTIRGSAGWIDYDGTTLTLSRGQAGAPDAHIYDADAVYADSYAAVIREFAENVRSGASMEAALAANLETLELVEQAYRVAVRRTRA